MSASFIALIIILACYISGIIIGGFAAMLLIWGIIYKIAEITGMKAHDPYPTCLIIGTTIAGGFPSIWITDITAYNNKTFPVLLIEFNTTHNKDSAGKILGKSIITIKITNNINTSLCRKFISQLATFISSDACGIKGSLAEAISPLALGHGTVFFTIMVLFLCMAVTNFMNNGPVA